jgi:uncharacterized DUF497 family protein
MNDKRQPTFHVQNLRKHGIGLAEAEEALYDGWDRRRKDGPNYEVLGRTEEGRYLQLVVEVTSDAIRVFHGRDMTPAERSRYKRK